MFRFFFLFSIITVTISGKAIEKVAEQQAQNSEITISEHGSSNEFSSSGGKGGKYASGAELTSLAHSAALQAKAVAQNQQTAGTQAAFGAKNQLAQAALGAANTAQAALVGKQVIVQNLEYQLHDAEKQLEAEIGQYQHSQQVARAAQEVAHQAQQQLNALTAALAGVQASVQHAQKVASEAHGAAAAQHSMIQEAEQRVAFLGEKLHNTAAELQETEVSAAKAAAAANLAQTNAAAASSAVTLNAAQSEASSGHDDYHH